MQDLSGFKVPGGFRGGGAIKVQLWWACKQHYFAGHRRSCIAGVRFYYECLVQK